MRTAFPLALATAALACALFLPGNLRAETAFFNTAPPTNADDAQLERAARSGNTDAQYLLGFMLAARGEKEELAGWKTKATMLYKKSADWFHRAAVSGHGKAQFSIGYLRYTGKGIGRDLQKSRKWLTAAAKQGVPEAMFVLAQMHARGDGVAQSRSDALRLFIAAGAGFAQEGNPELTLEAAKAVNQLAPGSQAARELVEIAQKVAQSPRQNANRGMSTGTGWVVGQGLVATNFHVVRGHQRISLVTQDGNYLPARIGITDPDNDLALLQVEDPCTLPPALPLAESPAGLGAEVFTVGFPEVAVMGASPKLSTGRVTGLAGIQGDPRTLQISVPIAQGNSGGPLVNLNGEVVGVIVARLKAAKVFMASGELHEDVNYAIKADRLSALLERAPQSGGVKDFIKGLFSNECPGTHPVKPESLEAHAANVQQSVFMIVAE